MEDCRFLLHWTMAQSKGSEQRTACRVNLTKQGAAFSISSVVKLENITGEQKRIVLAHILTLKMILRLHYQ